jgi:hypothetical protein
MWYIFMKKKGGGHEPAITLQKCKAVEDCEALQSKGFGGHRWSLLAGNQKS